MKKLSILFSFLFLTTLAMAQEEYTAHNKGWIVDLEEAYQISKETGKPIMANFTGSDWCGWCHRLTDNVFSKPQFKEWAEENVVLLELDFPRRKQLPNKFRQQNYSLQQAFKVRGYPTVWVFHIDKNEQGQFAINALGRTGYTPTAEQFISGIDQMIARANKSE